VNDLYEIVSSEPSVELVPPNRTRPIRVVTARAKKSGVVYFFAVRGVDFAASHIALIAHDLAGYFDVLDAKPGVVGVTVEQSVNPGETVDQKVRVLVESTSGDSTGEVVLKWGDALGPSGYKLVAAERAQLDEVEGL
jgi:hypothetical protein